MSNKIIQASKQASKQASIILNDITSGQQSGRQHSPWPVGAQSPARHGLLRSVPMKRINNNKQYKQ